MYIAKGKPTKLLNIMHKAVLLFFLFLTIFSSLAQIQTQQQITINNIYDSIFTLLQNTNDTIYIDTIFDVIKKDRKELGDHYLKALNAYVAKSNELGYLKGKMDAYDRIGLQYRYDEVYDSALFYHNLSLKIALYIADSTQLYYSYNNIGQVYRLQDLNVQAINNFHNALKISDATGNYKSSSFTMNALGATYVVQKNYEKAMYYFRQSTDIAIKNNDIRTLAYNYGSIGEIYLIKNINDSAMFYFTESKKLIEQTKNKKGLSVAEHLIGQAHFALNNYDSAAFYFNKALKMHIPENNKRYQALCYAYLGKIKTLQHKPDSAAFYLQKSEIIANDIHSFENLILAYNSLFELYKNTNQHLKAIDALQKKHDYSDSILNATNQKEIKAIEITYEVEKKEQKINLLNAENQIKNQRIKTGLVLIALLIVGILAVIYIYVLRKRHDKLTNDKLHSQLLLSQMNPHFIFNALASIQSFMYKNDTKKAALYLGNFASLARSVLQNSAADDISLTNEVDTLKNYIELEKMRLANSFDYFIDIDQNIDADYIKIPPMMLQPFVENAIKHGLKQAQKTGLLNISFTEQNNLIKATITDNGVGINASVATKNNNHKSMALAIFKQRMKILKHKYKNIPDLTITDISTINQSGTQVTVYLPIFN